MNPGTLSACEKYPIPTAPAWGLWGTPLPGSRGGRRRLEWGGGDGGAALETSAGEHLVGFLSPATPRGSCCPWLVPGAREGEKAEDASPVQSGLVF